jgi:hypothetical protein
MTGPKEFVMRTGKLNSAPNCPSCEKLLDGFTHLAVDSAPNPGDVTVCCYCSAVLQFTDDLNLTHADADNLAEVDFVELQQVHRAINFLKNRKA